MDSATIILASAAGGGLVLAGAGVFVHAVVSPDARLFGQVCNRSPLTEEEGERQVALTFDDGPWPESTPTTLRILEHHKAKAAFFLIGSRVAQYPDLVRQITDGGHLLANHSWHHFHHGWRRSAAFWRDEITRTNDAIARSAGVRPRLFRPPLGFKGPGMMRACRELRMQTVTWTRRAFDGVPTTSQRVLSRLSGRTRGGDILCLHDGIDPFGRRNPQATLDALDPLITAIKSRGLHFARVDELIGIPGYA